MIPVRSSNLAAVEYNSETQTLLIEFRNGTLYAYYDVPSSVYEELLNAPSLGKYHAAYIKKQYTYRRI